MANMSTDFYNVVDFVNEIKKNYTPDVSENTLMLGMYGYLGEVFSNAIQNSVIMASEFSNEAIPTKAKYERNIIAHALGVGIKDINAIPATMEVLLTIVEDDLLKQMKENVFTFDRTNKIFFGDYEFHPDYDIRITRVKLSNGKYTYVAKYVIDIDNPISDITNPYLTPPATMNVQGVNVVFTKVLLRQVELTTISKKIITTNTIDSKTFNFEFDSQLAAFTVDVTENGVTTHLVPEYEGLTVSKSKYNYIYYSYLDSKTIRCKFDRNFSYAPRLNSDIVINLQTSQGESANFTWTGGNPQFVFDSDKYGYTNLMCEIRPLTGEAIYGSDKKTIDELKRTIPMEALARDSITNLTDLENFFNMIDTENSKAYLFKKRDNCLERLYYTYLIVKNSIDIIVPTNTIDIRVDKSDLISEEETKSLKQTLKKGTVIRYEYGGIGHIMQPGEIIEDEDTSSYVHKFYYTIPYDMGINTDPLYVLYRLSSMNYNKDLDFSYINENAMYQFIATSINWYRPYIEDDGTYTLTINFEQNILDDYYMVDVDSEGNILDVRLYLYMVLYNEEDKPYRWCRGEITAYDKATNIFTAEFKLKTKDYINSDNKIRIESDGLYDVGATNESYGYMTANTKAVIHITSFQDADYGLNNLDSIIPEVAGTGLTLSNSYTVMTGIDFFHNFSEIINSVAIAQKEIDENGAIIEDSDYHFIVKGVPVIKHDYFSTEDKAEDFFDELLTRKNYIDRALTVIEDNFGIDFKFFNTYGPSRLFTIDNELEVIDRVNISLTFRLRLNPSYDPNIVDNIIRDIKDYVEDINDIVNFHAPNLITQITNDYREDIVFFEFVDMNGYGPGVQHLYNMQDLKTDTACEVPEFININTLEVLENNTLVYKPDINIVIV